ASLESHGWPVMGRFPACDLGKRKMTAVPNRAPVVVQVEVIDTLVEQRPHQLRVRRQRTEQRCRAAPLCADHDEPWFHAEPSGGGGHAAICAFTDVAEMPGRPQD